MANTSTVLKAQAIEVISTVKGFDMNECVAVQFDLTEEFFNAMYQSRGWVKACKENEVEESRQAVELAVELLNNTIETMVASGELTIQPAEEEVVAAVSKSEQIRIMTQQGMTRKEIAQALNVRYQMVRNVQVKMEAA